MKLLLFLFVITNMAYAKPVAKIIYLKGDIFVKTGDRDKRLYKGATLKNEQVIIAKKKSMAIVAFGPYFQSKIKVAPQTELRITESIGRSQGPLPVKNYNIFLKAGNILINFLKSKTKALTVQTKTAALGVRGTTFFTHVGENQATLMTVNKGEVAISSSNSDGEVIIEKGTGTMTNQDGKVIEPREFDWEKEVNWNLNPNKGKLAHSKDLHQIIAASYEKYKKEQEAKLKAFHKRINRQREMLNKDIEEQKKRMFHQR